MPGLKRRRSSLGLDPGSGIENELGTVGSTTIGMVIDDGDDEEERMCCQICFEKGHTLEFLGPVILQKNESVPNDYDQWKQCYRCGRQYANSEVKRESKIDDIVDV